MAGSIVIATVPVCHESGSMYFSLCITEIYYLYKDMKVTTFSKSRRMQQAGHVNRMNIIHQRKPCNKQSVAPEGYENPGKDGKME
jgi:hypothetical protein